jgi:hypothetical protein
MSEIADFISENSITIILIILSILGLLVYISIYNINLDPPKSNTQLAQSVTVETFEQDIDESIKSGLAEFNKQNNDGYNESEEGPIVKDGVDNFCEKYSSSPEQLKTACNNISNATCQNLSCCALISVSGTDTCVAANKYGPMVRNLSDENGTMITMDHYYYQGTKYTVSK